MMFSNAVSPHHPIGFAACCTGDSIRAVFQSPTAQSRGGNLKLAMIGIVDAAAAYAGEKKSFRVGSKPEKLSGRAVRKLCDRVKNIYYKKYAGLNCSTYDSMANAAIHLGASVEIAISNHAHYADAISQASFSAEDAVKAMERVMTPFDKNHRLSSTLSSLYKDYLQKVSVNANTSSILSDRARKIAIALNRLQEVNLNRIEFDEAEIASRHLRMIYLEAQIASTKLLMTSLNRDESRCLQPIELLESKINDSRHEHAFARLAEKRSQNVLMGRLGYLPSQRRLEISKTSLSFLETTSIEFLGEIEAEMKEVFVWSTLKTIHKRIRQMLTKVSVMLKKLEEDLLSEQLSVHP